MAKRYLDTDPLSGTKHYVDYDPIDDAMHYITEYDPAELLRHNHFARTEQPRSTHGKDMVFVARLPINVLLDLQRRGIFQDKKAYLRWLEANPKFKTWDGKLI